MHPDYESLTLEELEAAIQDVMAQREQLRQTQRELNAAYTIKRAEEEARRTLEAMSDEERAALAQIIQVEGFKTRSTFGELGANE